MKRYKSYFKIIKSICSLILLAIVTYNISTHSSYFKRPNIGNLESARITGLRLGGLVKGNSRSLSFDLKSPEQVKILSMVLRELQEGNIEKINDSNAEFIHPGGASLLELYFKDGAVIQIKSSVTFIKEIDDGRIVYSSKKLITRLHCMLIICKKQ